MAKFCELDSEFYEWAAERPEPIQEMIRRFPPDRLYRLKGGSRVTIVAYDDEGTVMVDVSRQYNLVIMERRVFGVNPDDLVECDLPAAGEILGSFT